MCIGYYISPSSLCFGLFIVHHLFADSVQVMNDSNLQSLFYKMAYHAASMIDYSKQPLEASTKGNPLP